MSKNVVLFFGAGAEYGEQSFNLPSGAAYTLATMRQRRKLLYDALNAFYATRFSGDFVTEYRKKFMFEKGSHTFNEIIYRAALAIIRKNDSKDLATKLADYSDYCDIINLVNEIEAANDSEADSPKIKEEKKDKRAAFKEKAKNAYDRLIKNDETKDDAKRNPGEVFFADFLTYYGAVEKDFSSIISPKDVGETQFWRLMNYYWGAFFTILDPIRFNFPWGSSEEMYSYTLNHLSSVIEDVWSHIDYSEYDSRTGNYYRYFAQEYMNSKVLTTNYTPFIEHYFGKENAVYLAGRLCDFEFPKELCVKDLSTGELSDSDFVFPFLMTQAPIKPLVATNQINDYYSALHALGLAELCGSCTGKAEINSDGHTLIIIGYSIGDADNHINAMLRQFVQNSKNKLVYCHFVHNNEYKNEDEKKHLDKGMEFVKKGLHLSEDFKNIEIVLNLGNPEELLQRVKKRIAGS